MYRTLSLARGRRTYPLGRFSAHPGENGLVWGSSAGHNLLTGMVGFGMGTGEKRTWYLEVG